MSSQIGHLINSKYNIRSVISRGTFGTIYHVSAPEGQSYVAKIEHAAISPSILSTEYFHLLCMQRHEGFPNVFHYGLHEKCPVIIMQRLGDSVFSRAERMGGRLPLATLCHVASQVVRRLKTLHDAGIVHRDIKPGNLMFASNASDQSSQLIYLVDFGLSERFRDILTQNHEDYEEGRSVIGTPLYASLHALSGVRQSRRDDMESLGYSLVDLGKGELPWEEVTREGSKGAMSSGEIDENIAEVKSEVSFERLCEGLPNVFERFLYVVCSLGFYEEPPYECLARDFEREREEILRRERQKRMKRKLESEDDDRGKKIQKTM